MVLSLEVLLVTPYQLSLATAAHCRFARRKLVDRRVHALHLNIFCSNEANVLDGHRDT